MLVRFVKAPPAAPADTVACVRPDGSTATAPMPRQGVLPRAAVHFVVETTLGWHDGLFGRVAHGADFAQVEEHLHAQRTIWSKMTQALQSEALAECLQAEQWAGPADPADFAQRLVQACRRRGVEPPEITPEELAAVRVALREFGAAWRPLRPGGALERTFRT